jgi:hypothetical protein
MTREGPSSGQRARDCSKSPRASTDEDLQKLGPRERSPVHEDSRRASNAESNSLVEIPLHRWAMDAFRHAALEPHAVEAHLGRVPLQVLRCRLRGMGEWHVVVFPELALLGGTAGCLRCTSRLKMRPSSGKSRYASHTLPG